MKISNFIKIRSIKPDEYMGGLNIGDIFLYGNSMVEQISTKKIGDYVTYYSVTNVTDRGITYEPIMEKLEG